jgi:hypothetical protein
MPPIQCVRDLQNKSERGILSASTITEAPVVVKPPIVSKNACVKSGITPDAIKGIQPRSEALIHARETNRKPLLGEIEGTPRRPKPKYTARKIRTAAPIGIRKALTFTNGSPYRTAMSAHTKSGTHRSRRSIDRSRKIIFIFISTSSRTRE